MGKGDRISMKKVFITGGTGFIGTSLVKELVSEGFDVTILTRKSPVNNTFPSNVQFIEGDPAAPGEWQKNLADSDLVINLAGASIFRRWTKKSKQAIRDSRVMTTRNLVEGIKSGKGSETLIISASAVGYYGFHGDEDILEESPPGNDFLATVCKEWETAALKAAQYGAKVLLCRFGIVLGKNGGALSMMLPIFKLWLGSRLGNGSQWFSWIHEQDLVNIILFLVKQKEVSGPVNCTSPEPVQNKEMTRILKKVLKSPSIMPPLPGFMMKVIMGEFGDILLKGQKVLPDRISKMGYTFQFPDIQGALEDLIAASSNYP
jgi:uncharacterized protein (TIGR01777 family)